VLGIRFHRFEKDWREGIVYTRIELIDSETGEVLRELGEPIPNVPLIQCGTKRTKTSKNRIPRSKS